MREKRRRKSEMHHSSEEKKIVDLIKGNLFIFGLLSGIWFLVRTGRKPSRAMYPCQQAALFNTNIWIASYVLPVVMATERMSTIFQDRKKVMAVVGIVTIAAGIGGYSWYLTQSVTGQSIEQAITEYGLTLDARTASVLPASDIFVVTGTDGADDGVEALIGMMGEQGLLFYKSMSSGRDKGPDGLISADDVIIIKVNCQWDERGGTNTDLLRSLIQTIIDHPDGFTGEIIVSDNGQGENRGSLRLGGSFTYLENNALDPAQSIQKVVDSFAESHKVSTYLWSDITETRVYEYIEGDFDDGYIVNTTANPGTGIMVSYAKFKTEYGTFVSFKKGVYDYESNTYDNERLKVINLSMLKSHSVYGVTASVKNYMGVPSDVITSEISGRSLATHSTIGRGGLGTLMVETRYPVLNIIDAIWINAVPGNGPWTPYESATKTSIITASKDPVALDYWSVKYILHQAWQVRTNTDSESMNPDNTTPGFFGYWLRLSMDELIRGGYQVNIDEEHMNVYLYQIS